MKFELEPPDRSGLGVLDLGAIEQVHHRGEELVALLLSGGPV